MLTFNNLNVKISSWRKLTFWLVFQWLHFGPSFKKKQGNFFKIFVMGPNKNYIPSLGVEILKRALDKVLFFCKLASNKIWRNLIIFSRGRLFFRRIISNSGFLYSRETIGNLKKNARDYASLTTFSSYMYVQISTWNQGGDSFTILI